jgi:tetratricopeptide (TPR) repeat protein
MAAIMDAIGSIKFKQKKYDEAEKLFLEVYNLNKGSYVNGNVREAINLTRIGLLYSETGQYKKAVPFLKKAYEINKEGFPEGHDKTALSAYHYAICLRALQKYKMAEPLLKYALPSLQTLPDKYKKQIQEIQQILLNP